MATVSDITTTPLSGLNHIDALLDSGPDWNYLGAANNTLYYTFSITSGNEAGQSGQLAFSLAQQIATRGALDYISALTGIRFTEVVDGTSAQIHLCNVNLKGANVTGLCSWHSSYTYLGNELRSYEASAYVYLDSVEFYAQNHNLNRGTYGYETLLHELGHALGLKHPFDDSINLGPARDNTNYTLMSYTDAGGPHSTYSEYDIAALNWLYGGDGLGGAFGINSTTGGRYVTGTSGADTLTGTAANDKLEGDGGNDMIDGGLGFDTAVFRGVRGDYGFSVLDNGDLLVRALDGLDGTDTLRSIELLQFADMSVNRADIGKDVLPPDQPSLVVTKNVNGYTTGNTPIVTGKAEAGATLKIYLTGSNQQVGTATADANGLYTVKLDPFADGLAYSVYATATDAAGNVSLPSDAASFKVDATPPWIPTYSMTYTAGSNQATFQGGAEAGSTVELVRASDLQTIARTVVGSDSVWTIKTSPLPNGSYAVSVVSFDQADNATSADNRATLEVSSEANLAGGDANDVFRPGTGNNAVDGGAGLDTAVYAGGRANYTLAQEAWGYGVVDKVGGNGHDALINVERVHFGDAWVALDIEGTAGQLFRLYSAAFGRASDEVGMGYWIWRVESGSSLNTVAQEFMTGQPEFDKLYGVEPTDLSFITKLYNNVLHRDPDAAGYDFWLKILANDGSGDHTALRAQVLIDFADSLENQVNVIGGFQHGIDFVPWIHA